MSSYILLGRVAFSALALLALWGKHSSAQTVPSDTLTVSLPQAVAIAIESSPDLAARSWDPITARGDARGASAFPFNPELLFESRSPSDGLGQRYEAELGIQLEVAGQRGLRIDAAGEAVQAADSRFREAGRLVLADVGRAYHRLVAAEQRLALLAAIEESNERLSRAVRTQLAEGEVSLLEANLVAVEAARARARAVAQQAARTSAALELGRLLGVDSRTELRTVGPADQPEREAPASLDEALGRARADRPDLRSNEQELERARQDERLARRERLPNLRLAALLTREDPLVDARLGVAVGIELPLFNRNQGATARRSAELSGARAALRATEARVRIEVEEAYRRYQAVADEVELLEAELLGPSRENQRLLDIAYREGKIDLASLLLVRNQLLDAELGYWDAWERRERALTDLQSATGTILDGLTFTLGMN